MCGNCLVAKPVEKLQEHRIYRGLLFRDDAFPLTDIKGNRGVLQQPDLRLNHASVLLFDAPQGRNERVKIVNILGDGWSETYPPEQCMAKRKCRISGLDVHHRPQGRLDAPPCTP